MIDVKIIRRPSGGGKSQGAAGGVPVAVGDRDTWGGWLRRDALTQPVRPQDAVAFKEVHTAGMIEAQRGDVVSERVRSHGATAAGRSTGSVGAGFDLYDDGARSALWVDELHVRGAFEAQGSETRAALGLAGVRVLSAVASRIASVHGMTGVDADGNAVRTGYKCYLAPDTGAAAQYRSPWRGGDQALCQTFGRTDGTGHACSRYYWRLVVETGADKDEGPLLPYVVLSNQKYCERVWPERNVQPDDDDAGDDTPAAPSQARAQGQAAPGQAAADTDTPAPPDDGADNLGGTLDVVPDDPDPSLLGTLATGCHYEDGENICDPPAAGDRIVLLGAQSADAQQTTDLSRERGRAIVVSATDNLRACSSALPSVRVYAGISGFTLPAPLASLDCVDGLTF